MVQGLPPRDADRRSVSHGRGPVVGAAARSFLAHRFTRYLREVALAERDERLVVFVDEIDTTLRLDFTDDFFAAIRFLYQNRAADPDLHRLSFVLIGVATPGDLIKDAARTPFNIGHRIDLTDFTLDEASSLADHLACPPSPRSDRVDAGLDRRPSLPDAAGDPFARRVAAAGLDRQPSTSAIQQLFLRAGAETDSNLQFVRDMLTKKAFNREAVLRTYGNIRRGERSRTRSSIRSAPG